MEVNMSMEVLSGEINFVELVDNFEELLQWIHKKQNELLEIGSQMMKKNNYAARPPLYIRLPGTKRTAESEILEDKKKPSKKPKSVMKKVRKPRPVAGPPVPAPAPAMPGELMTAITDRGGEDVVWVIEKLLTKTDVNWHHDRLSIPEGRVATTEFLSSTEKIKGPQKVKIPLEVVLLVTGEGEDDEDPRTQSWLLNFTKWLMGAKWGLRIDLKMV